MKIQLSKERFPRSFSRHPYCVGCIHEADISLGSSRLKLKLMVFQMTANLKRFWKDAMGKGSLGKGCIGAVNSLACENIDVCSGKSKMECDSRYFAIMGLCVDHLGMEVITHESVHAGISYTKRTGSRNLWHDPLDMDEEKIAYPVGKIAANIVRSLRKAKLI